MKTEDKLKLLAIFKKWHEQAAKTFELLGYEKKPTKAQTASYYIKNRNSFYLHNPLEEADINSEHFDSWCNDFIANIRVANRFVKDEGVFAPLMGDENKHLLVVLAFVVQKTDTPFLFISAKNSKNGEIEYYHHFLKESADYTESGYKILKIAFTHIVEEKIKRGEGI